MARLKTTSIQTKDNYLLAATIYEPYRKLRHSDVVVVNAGAGIPQTFYKSFAAWLADEGVCVVTYDYRGIGRSRGRSISGLSATIRDWGSKDCAAVLSYVRQKYPLVNLSVIAHSIGGVVTGFVTPPPQIKRFLLVSPHTGYSGDYDKHSMVQMFVFWHCIMPVLTYAAGYFPGRRLGLPEDLPYGIAMEWARRWNRTCLVRDRRCGPFANIATRALVLRPDDDPFATLVAMQRVRSHFPFTDFTDLVVSARPGNSRIGHFGFFKVHNRERLWPLVLKWLSFGDVGALDDLMLGPSTN